MGPLSSPNCRSCPLAQILSSMCVANPSDVHYVGVVAFVVTGALSVGLPQICLSTYSWSRTHTTTNVRRNSKYERLVVLHSFLPSLLSLSP